MTSVSAEYWAGQQAQELTLHTLRIRVFLTVLVFLAVLGTIAGVFFVKIDQKFSATQRNSAQALQVVKKIRTDQIANLNRNSALAQCQSNDFNKAFEALNLAFAGDHNPADYPTKAQPCVLQPLPKPKAKK